MQNVSKQLLEKVNSVKLSYTTVYNKISRHFCANLFLKCCSYFIFPK